MHCDRYKEHQLFNALNYSIFAFSCLSYVILVLIYAYLCYKRMDEALELSRASRVPWRAAALGGGRMLYHNIKQVIYSIG